MCNFKKEYNILETFGQGAHSMVYKVERVSDKYLFASKMTKYFDNEIKIMVKQLFNY